MKNNIWDTKIEVEENLYNWKKEPIFINSTKKVNKDYIHIDLFSGCGGFSEGFKQAGFTTTLALDIHPPSLKTLQYNSPETNLICGDIRKINYKLISDYKTKKPLVITAGVPCQGFSLSNRKRHSEDKRNFLFQEFIKVTKSLNPTAVILENVSGLVSTAKGYFKDTISKAIEDLGFNVSFSTLNACYYGVPQKRKRVFFVGTKKNNWLFPEFTHGHGLKPFVTVKDAILGDLPSLNSGESSKKYISSPQSDYQKYLRKNSSELLNHEAPNHPEETILKIKNTRPGEPMYPKFRQRIRLNLNDLSPTQICGGIRPQFQFGHPTQARGLTIRERARIQSFPDNYFFDGGIVQGRVQTGNAVPPLLAKSLAKQLINLFNGKTLEGIKHENSSQKEFNF
jgi:DNA (cytosine-5)-methyltransferase 1